MVVRGSLAPDTAIVKLSVTEDRPATFEGPARVFDDAPSAIAGIEGGEVRPGDVLVLRGLGPVGTPAWAWPRRPSSRSTAPPDRAGLGGDRRAAVRTRQQGHRGRRGLPEGALPGPLGVVADGDRIAIDLDVRRVDLLVDERELARRHAGRERHRVPGDSSGWLSVYARSVEPLPLGATLRGNDLPTSRP